MARVTFIQHATSIEEYGRGLYAVARSILRAMLEQLGHDDLADLQCVRSDVTLRQLAKISRLNRDKGMRGDGFEWAIHEAILGNEPSVCELFAEAICRVTGEVHGDNPESLLFGQERARYYGFLDAVVGTAGEHAVILPDEYGQPYAFGPWVSVAAEGHAAEHKLPSRIRQIWKTDLFVTGRKQKRYAAATVKSNWHQLELGRGLRIGVAPEAPDSKPGIRQYKGLWLVSLPDPQGFMGLFNDAYHAVAHAICTLGKHERPPYFHKPSAKAQRIQEQLERHPTARVVDIEGALNEAAQQDLVNIDYKLLSVEAPDWLHLPEKSIPIIAPKPTFESLD